MGKGRKLLNYEAGSGRRRVEASWADGWLRINHILPCLHQDVGLDLSYFPFSTDLCTYRSIKVSVGIDILSDYLNGGNVS